MRRIGVVRALRMNWSIRFPLLALFGLLASCVPQDRPAVTPTPSPSAAGNESRDRVEVTWDFDGEDPPISYDLYAVVNGKRTSVGGGDEYLSPRQVAPGMDGVPASALSGYWIGGPDGEDSVYYATRDPSTFDVKFYRRDWMPMSGGGYSQPEIVATVQVF